MAKKLRDEDLVLNIIVNGDRGRKELGQLERSIRDTRKELEYLEAEEKKLRAEGKKDTAHYKAVTAAIKQKNVAIDTATARMTQLRKGMDLNRLSMSELRREMSRLARLRNSADPLTASWKKHDAQLSKVKARYMELRAQSEATGGSIKRMTTGINRMFGSIAAGVASFYALAFGVRRATDEFISFDDKVADVQKTTGLTREEVLSLNETLKDTEEIDTRTTQEGLLGLLRIAGKLGIEGRDNLLGFTKASDQIAVALTEDLGGDIEQSINTVGKLVGVYNVSDEFGIEKGLLKVGSSINELGASSEANEGFIVDFTKRLAGVAPGAKISIANIMGMGAALDVAGQSVEVSGTAVSQVITRMFEDTAAFAKIANIELSEFSDLLEKDANEAFIKVLEGIKGSNEPMEAMVKRLKSLGIDGVRATNVVSVLANNVDNLRAQQKLANESFKEGTSITDEFNIKNSNAAAQLAKSKREVNNLWIALGERLYPVLLAGQNLLKTFLQILITIIDFISENRKVIIALTTAVVTYTIAVKAASLASKLAAVNFRLLTKAMLKNPFSLIAAAIAGVVAYLITYKRELSATERVQKTLEEATKRANDQVAEEKVRVQQLLKFARDKTVSDENRAKAIKQLNDLSPEYLGNLTLEKINTEEATKAVDDYIVAITRRAKAQAIQEALVENQRKQLNVETNRQETALSSEQKARVKLLELGKAHTEASVLAAKFRYENSLQLQEELKKEEQLLLAQIDATDVLTKKSGLTGGFNNEDPGQGKTHKPFKADQSDDVKKFRQEVLDAQLSAVELEQKAYQERLKQAGIFGKEIRDLQGEDRLLAEALLAEHYRNLNSIDAEAITRELDRRRQAFESELNIVRTAHNEELNAIQTLEEAKAALAETHSQEELDKIKTINQAKEELAKVYAAREHRLAEVQASELLAILKDVVDNQEWQGITADDVLSEDELEVLNKKIEEIKLQLSELGLVSRQPEQDQNNIPDELNVGKTDILGFTQEDWHSFFYNLDTGRQAIETMQMATMALSQAWAMHNQIALQADNRRIQSLEERVNRERSILDRKLEQDLQAVKGNSVGEQKVREKHNKAIEKLEKKLDREKAIVARKQASRDKAVALFSAITNTAAGVARALKDFPFPFSQIIGILVAALGAAQIGTIASQPLPSIPGAESGGYIDVVRSQDRRMFRAKSDPSRRGYVDAPTIIAGESGRELVASNEAYNNPSIRPILDIIDTAQRNGSISTINLSKVLQDRSPVGLSGRQSGGFIDSSIPSSARPSETSSSNDPEIKTLLRQSVEINRRLTEQLKKGVNAKVSLLGEGGFYEADEQYQEVKNDVNL